MTWEENTYGVQSIFKTKHDYERNLLYQDKYLQYRSAGISHKEAEKKATQYVDEVMPQRR